MYNRDQLSILDTRQQKTLKKVIEKNIRIYTSIMSKLKNIVAEAKLYDTKTKKTILLIRTKNGVTHSVIRFASTKHFAIFSPFASSNQTKIGAKDKDEVIKYFQMLERNNYENN